jgi:hypothetical protein
MLDIKGDGICASLLARNIFIIADVVIEVEEMP